MVAAKKGMTTHLVVQDLRLLKAFVSLGGDMWYATVERSQRSCAES